MARRAWVTLWAILNLGCGGASYPTTPGPVASSTAPSAPVTSSRKIFGVITAGSAPAAGVQVDEIATDSSGDCFDPQVLSNTMTDATGTYNLEAVSPAALVWVRASKPGYFTEFKRPTVPQDTRIDIALDPLAFISVGQHVRQTLRIGDTPCYGNSYGGGPCRRFAVAVSSAGILDVTLSWSSPRPDVVLDVVRPGNSPCALFSWPGGSSHHVRVPAEAGATYQIRVIDDGSASPLDFELATALE